MKKFFNSMSDRMSGNLDSVGRRGLTRLQEAIDQDDIKRLRELIKRGANINDPGLTGQPPLQRALALNRAEIASELVDAGADVNFPDNQNTTALHLAVLQGDRYLVAKLLENGADVNACDTDGRTALHLLPAGHSELASMLCQYGADTNATDNHGRLPLHMHLRDERILRVLFENGADVNRAGPVVPSPFAVALGIPLVASHPECVLLLLLRGGDPDTRAVNGETLAHLAGRLGQRELFMTAVRKTDLTLVDNDGNTALHALARLPQPEMLRHLLMVAPHLAQKKNNAGETATGILLDILAVAPARGAETHLSTLFQSLRILLENGADPSSAGANGETLLHHAVRRNALDAVDFLAQRGCDFDRRNKAGAAALHLAVEGKLVSFVDRMLDHGADPDLTDARGWTLLDRLAERGDRDSPIVQRLIVAGGRYAKQLPLYPELMRPRDATPEPPAPANDTGHILRLGKAKTPPAQTPRKQAPPG